MADMYRVMLVDVCDMGYPHEGFPVVENVDKGCAKCVMNGGLYEEGIVSAEAHLEWD